MKNAFRSRWELKKFLDRKANRYNSPDFIPGDPVSIPHRFAKKQDIEIAGFFAATLAWGQRRTIIRKCEELIARMDHAPHEFLLSHQPRDLKRFEDFRHRTFNGTDTLYFIYFLSHYYKAHDSLEDAFLPSSGFPAESPVESGLNHFQHIFSSMPVLPARTLKHVPAPARHSACKRLNMFLRWMVRHDKRGVDFGLWKRISPAHLICPCDVHVERVARKLKLITRKSVDWQMALELTANLRSLDAADPVKYDFALFGLGVEEKF
jgi:uncharacterized protein (TIGR02757 family)